MLAAQPRRAASVEGMYKGTNLNSIFHKNIGWPRPAGQSCCGRLARVCVCGADRYVTGMYARRTVWSIYLVCLTLLKKKCSWRVLGGLENPLEIDNLDRRSDFISVRVVCRNRLVSFANRDHAGGCWPGANWRIRAYLIT